MQFSRKTIAIIALVVILAASNVAFAVLYMTKNITITGGVQTVGAIEVYDSDGVTPLVGFGYPLFTPGTQAIFSKSYFINNTGNEEMNVNYNISSSSIQWYPYGLGGYAHNESGVVKYYLLTKLQGEFWGPNQYWGWWAVGAGKSVETSLWYTGEPTTHETFTLVLSFYADDGL